jgi:hypothetical protein
MQAHVLIACLFTMQSGRNAKETQSVGSVPMKNLKDAK